MAAPLKMGLDYFPFSVDLTSDEKLIEPQVKHGYLSKMVFIELLVILYSDKGYYIDYRKPHRILWQIQTRLQGGENNVSTKTIENVISDLVEAGLFDVVQFESGILTSSRTQQTWYMATVGRKIVEIDESIWLLSLNEMKSLSSKHLLYVNMSSSVDNHPINHSKSTDNHPINYSKSTDLPPKEKEIKLNKTKEEGVSFSLENGKDTSGNHTFGSDWELLLERWQSLSESTVKVVIPTWLVIPPSVSHDFLMRCSEHGIERVLATVDLLRNSPYWQNRQIGIDKFLREETFLKLHGSGYDWNPDTPKQNPKSDKSKNQIIQSDEQVGKWSWQNKEGSEP